MEYIHIRIFNDYLNFRHWISISFKCSLPIRNKLYPAHYSMLYYTKGKPNTFNKLYTKIEKCRHCDGDIKDYGGHKKKLNENGLNLTDIWTDLSPVRHRNKKNRPANELPIELVSRAILMSTNPGDTVLDPFMDSGTTAEVCELNDRRWIGIEIGENNCKYINKRVKSAISKKYGDLT